MHEDLQKNLENKPKIDPNEMPERIGEVRVWVDEVVEQIREEMASIDEELADKDLPSEVREAAEEFAQSLEHVWIAVQNYKAMCERHREEFV